jgi:hypothetical protein
VSVHSCETDKNKAWAQARKGRHENMNTEELKECCFLPQKCGTGLKELFQKASPRGRNHYDI